MNKINALEKSGLETTENMLDNCNEKGKLQVLENDPDLSNRKINELDNGCHACENPPTPTNNVGSK